MRLVAIGLVAGLFSALFGVGGGIIVVPLLVLVAGFGERVATAVSLGAIGTAIFFVVRTMLFGTDLPGFPSLIVSVMFFSGIQLMSLGIIGEYVGRIFAEVKRRPLYVVEDRLGFAAEASDALIRDDRRIARA